MNTKRNNQTITMALLPAFFIGCLMAYQPAIAVITAPADKAVKLPMPDDELEKTSTSTTSGTDATSLPEEPVGLMLYENHCTGCHESTVHIREKRKAKSYREVAYWVNQRADWLNLGWTSLEKQQVMRYVNQRYYKYPMTE